MILSYYISILNYFLVFSTNLSSLFKIPYPVIKMEEIRNNIKDSISWIALLALIRINPPKIKIRLTCDELISDASYVWNLMRMKYEGEKKKKRDL